MYRAIYCLYYFLHRVSSFTLKIIEIDFIYCKSLILPVPMHKILFHPMFL